MALTVEDGTGLAGADALASLAAANARAGAHGRDAWFAEGVNTADREAALRDASRYISDAFYFKGGKLTAGQAFAWPRYGVTDEDGLAVETGAIPSRVVAAVIEAAIAKVEGVDLWPVVEPGPTVSEERLGSLTIQYAAPAPGRRGPDLPRVRALLQPYLRAGGGNVRFITRGY